MRTEDVGSISSPTYQYSKANFEKPDGYVPGLGYARQMQIGARFIF